VTATVQSPGEAAQRLTLAADGTSARPPDRRPVRRGPGGVWVALAALIMLGATVITVSGQARHQVAVSFVPQPVKYTELYFTGDGPRQRGYGRDWVLLAVPFTVANHEGESTIIRYMVQAVDDREASVGRAEGTAELPDGTSVAVVADVAVPATERWAAVEVRLTGRSERIRFLAGRAIASGG
jgi:hypothetical protein